MRRFRVKRANGEVRETRVMNPESRYRSTVPEWMKAHRVLTGDHPETGASLSDPEACRRAAGMDKPKCAPVYDYQSKEDSLYQQELKRLDAKLGIEEDD